MTRWPRRSFPSASRLRVQPAAIVATRFWQSLPQGARHTASRASPRRIEEWAGAWQSRDKMDRLTRAAVSFRELPEDVGLRRTLVEKLPAEIQSSGGRAATDAPPRPRPTTAAAGFATAQLARLMIDHRRAEEALPLLKELEDRFRGVVCARRKDRRRARPGLASGAGRQEYPIPLVPLAGNAPLREAQGGGPRDAGDHGRSRRSADGDLLSPVAV